MDGEEGLTEVGTGGGVGVVVGEPLTSGGVLAKCLTFLLYQKCQNIVVVPPIPTLGFWTPSCATNIIPLL